MDQINSQLRYGHAYVEVTACYTGKEMVVAHYDRGTFESDEYIEATLVDKGLTDDELVEMFKTPKKNPFNGIDLNGAVKVKAWENDWMNRDEYTVHIPYYYESENCVVQFKIESKEKVKNYYMGFNEGDTFTLPSEMGDFKDIKWTDEGSWVGSGKDTYKKIDGSETFTAVKLMMFTGTGTYVEKNSTENGSTNNGTTGSDSSNSGSTAASAATYVPVTMPAEKISAQVTAITSAVSAGQKTIKVPMDGATVVPVAILEAAKGKDIDVVLDMGGYSWTINGKDIKASNLKDIDFKVNFDTNAIPSSLVSSLAGSNPTKQISLAYNGDFGFTASLSFNIGSQYQGKYGNLYYYDSNGKLVFMNAGKITSDGTVSLEFSHASDYVIVISEASMAPVAPKTGDDTALLVWFVLLFAGVTLLTAVYRKRAAR